MFHIYNYFNTFFPSCINYQQLIFSWKLGIFNKYFIIFPQSSICKKNPKQIAIRATSKLDWSNLYNLFFFVFYQFEWWKLNCERESFAFLREGVLHFWEREVLESDIFISNRKKIFFTLKVWYNSLFHQCFLNNSSFHLYFSNNNPKYSYMNLQLIYSIIHWGQNKIFS